MGHLPGVRCSVVTPLGRELFVRTPIRLLWSLEGLTSESPGSFHTLCSGRRAALTPGKDTGASHASCLQLKCNSVYLGSTESSSLIKHNC